MASGVKFCRFLIREDDRKNTGRGLLFQFQFQLTQVDLTLFHWLGFLAHGVAREPFKKYAELNKFLAKIAALPKVAEWLEKRPKTDMWTKARSETKEEIGWTACDGAEIGILSLRPCVW